MCVLLHFLAHASLKISLSVLGEDGRELEGEAFY